MMTAPEESFIVSRETTTAMLKMNQLSAKEVGLLRQEHEMLETSEV